MSLSHVAGSVVSVVGASGVQCIAVLRANQYARGLSVGWVEWLKRSPSASGVAVLVSGVNVWTLSVVPPAFHCPTHQVCWWHVSVTLGASRGLSRIVQSVTFGPSALRLCCSGGLVSCTTWSTRSGVRVSSVFGTLPLRALGCRTASSQASVVAARVLAARVMTSSVRPSTIKCFSPARVVGSLGVCIMVRCSSALLGPGAFDPWAWGRVRRASPTGDVVVSVGQSWFHGHVVLLTEGDGLARGVSRREVHSLGACYSVEVFIWEWGGLWG